MNWYTFLRHLNEAGIDLNTDRVIQLETADWVLTISTYHMDEWIRITSKRYTSCFYWRPFVGQNAEELKARMTRAGFRRLISE